jgi:Fur family transcriptional regulator, ferric uptake regulator
MRNKNYLPEKQKFQRYLNKSGLKFSNGRHSVFDVVMDLHGHFSAEDLCRKCENTGTKVSRATIYRSLKELLESGVVRETAFGEKHQHFEHVYDEELHHHARCIRCYGVIEFPCLKDDQRYRKYLNKKGFHVLGHEMHFYGVCQKCRTKGDQGA